jgi:trimeric autotransporter adhesin
LVHLALDANTTGNNNTAFGMNALSANTEGSSNTAIGYNALTNRTTGNANVAVGENAGFCNITGVGNTFIGREAGYCSTGSANIVIGSPNSGPSYTPVCNLTTESNRIVMGSTAVTNAYIQVGWTTVSDCRDKMNIVSIPHGLCLCKSIKSNFISI